MKILLIYPGHSHSTIDIATGYKNALRAIGHEVWPFMYHDQLAFYQYAIQCWMKKNKNFKPDDPAQATLVAASEQALIAAVDFVPDVILIVNGFALHKRAYDLIDKICLPLVLILTESPYLDGEQAKIIAQGHVRLAFTNDRSSLDQLREDSGGRIEYLPHSYDPTRHHKKDAVLDKYETDVFFFGTLWPGRVRLFEPVKKWCKRHKVKAEIGGVGFKTLKGMIDNEQLVRYYSATKIAINHHRTISMAKNGVEVHCENAYSLGPRAYEIAACKAFQLSDSRPELHEVFGDTVPVYTDADDLIGKLQYYLDFAGEREEIAEAAYQRVQSCSFEHRAREILLPTIEAVL
jgi:spore maturation protein CgeB